MDNNTFDDIHDSALDGWGFSFRRSQLYRFKKYLDMLIKNNIKVANFPYLITVIISQ